MNKSVVTALLIAIGAGAWIVSGQMDLFGDGPDTASAESAPPSAAEKPEESLVTVRARRIVAEPRTLQVVVRGRTEAVRTVDIKSETEGRISKVEVAEGARVSVGDVLVRVAAEERLAQHAETVALVKQREIEFKAAQSLKQKGFRSETAVAAAAANLDAARASLKRMDYELSHLVIKAPFDGVVETRYAELGDFLQVGDPVARIVDEDPFLVVAQVSERDIGKLQVGGTGRAELISGDAMDGVIRYIATTADSATRTFRVELEVPNDDRHLRDGITADIRFQTETVRAHFVSPASLTLDREGRIGVRGVDDDGYVRFWPADVIGDSPDGVWLAGLPDRLTLVTVGQEFVRAGDAVEVVLENPGPTS
ncbi:MAG: efflux RND transporter periplasmic adaptor subunit [Minwuiales bacterium]|nr:efflux RND transporter periplasmic adaptor subunit [Minwuiales bacterium]